MIKKIIHDKGISLAATWSFNQLAYAIVYPFIPIYLCNMRNYEYSQVSIIFPLLGLAAIIAPVPFGYLTDRFGHSFMMLFGQAARGVIFFILAFFVYIDAPFWVFALFLMLNTAVGAAFQVGSDAYLFSITTLNERPSYYSKIRMGFNVGWALGPMMGAFFSKTPFWLFFIITGLLCMAGTVYTKFVCCRTNTKQISAGPETPKRETFNIRDIAENRHFLLLITGTFFLMLTASQLYSTLSIFSTKTVGISSKELGMIYSLNGFMVLLLQIPLVALAAKMKMTVVLQLFLGAILYTVGYLQLGFAMNALFIAFCVAVITCGEIIIQPALYTAVSQQTKAENAGRMFSLNSLLRGIGYAAGPWIGGQLFTHCNSIILWSVMAFFSIISMFFFYYGNIRAANAE